MTKKFELSLKKYSLVVIKIIETNQNEILNHEKLCFGYNLKSKMLSFNSYYYKFNICFRFFFFF